MRPSRAVAALPVLWLLLLFFPAAVSAEETVCIQCHAGQPGPLGAPVSQWQGSVHQLNGVSCFHCHGGDPNDFAMAMSPERGFIGVPEENEIPGFCARCHPGVHEDYLRSAHGKALGAGGPTCVTCHGSHAVRAATPDLINEKDCSRCHEYGRAEEIKEAITETEAMMADLDRSIASLHRLGFRTEDKRGALFAVRNDFRRLFHSVDVDRVRSQTATFQQRLGEVRSEVKAVEDELARRKMWGGGVVALLVMGGVLAFLLHRSYMQEHRKEP